MRGVDFTHSNSCCTFNNQLGPNPTGVVGLGVACTCDEFSHLCWNG